MRFWVDCCDELGAAQYDFAREYIELTQLIPNQSRIIVTPKNSHIITARTAIILREADIVLSADCSSCLTSRSAMSFSSDDIDFSSRLIEKMRHRLAPPKAH